MRPFLAPSAVRTASSRTRASVRTITRFDTFAVATAISNAIDRMNKVRTTQKPSPPIKSLTGTSRVDQPPLVRGYSLPSAAPMAVISAAACSKVTPSRRRARNRRLR